MLKFLNFNNRVWSEVLVNICLLLIEIVKLVGFFNIWEINVL